MISCGNEDYMADIWGFLSSTSLSCSITSVEIISVVVIFMLGILKECPSRDLTTYFKIYSLFPVVHSFIMLCIIMILLLCTFRNWTWSTEIWLDVTFTYSGLVMANLGFQVNYKHLKLCETQGVVHNSGGYSWLNYLNWKKKKPPLNLDHLRS